MAKKIAIYNWNGIFNDIIPELEKKYELVQDHKKADLVCLWNEIEKAGWKEIVEDTQKRGKKSILFQQGVWGIDRVGPPFNEPILSDLVCVWGKGDKDRLIKYNVPEKKIIITGTPIIKHLKPKQEHNGKNILFALEHWDYDEVPENMIVARELRKLKGVNLITKGLKRENNLDIYENIVYSERQDPSHIDIVADILSKTDLLVAISESTIALLAQILDIPVIIADIWIPKPRAGETEYLNFKGNFSKAITKVKLDDLNKEIYNQLKHPEILREERAKNAIINGGIEIKDPLSNILKVIDENI